MSKTHAFRLNPGDDLKKEIDAFVLKNKIQAGWIACCVGSLVQYHIRFANQSDGVKSSGHFEILTLSGTVSLSGLHLHICIADNAGKTIGGHLLAENLIYTTAEIVIAEAEDLIFSREPDPATDWLELQVRKNI